MQPIIIDIRNIITLIILLIFVLHHAE